MTQGQTRQSFVGQIKDMGLEAQKESLRNESSTFLKDSLGLNLELAKATMEARKQAERLCSLLRKR